MRVRVGCELTYESTYPTPMLLLVRARAEHEHRIIAESRKIEPAGVAVHEYVDGFSNHVWRLVAPTGHLQVTYDAVAEVPATPDPVHPGLRKMPIEELPNETLVYTLPSRHCPSDLFIDEAWRLFGEITTGWEQVQAVCDWLHGNITYGAGSTASTTGWEAYQGRSGVCRDFAHMGVSFCRALNIPARYVCGYLPDIDCEPNPRPMDFHAWFEAYLDGAWRTFDARHNCPRVGRVRIGYGRDAVDLAFATIYGKLNFGGMKVWADGVADDFELEER